MDLDVSREGDRLKIDLNKDGWISRLFASGFLLFWLSGWTVGCVLLLVALIFHFQTFLFVFAIPFWASWILVTSVLLRNVLGKDIVLIDSRSIEIISGGPFLIEQRRVPLKELLGISVREDDRGEGVSYQLEFTTVGSTVLFGHGKKQDLLEAVRNRILEEIPDADRDDDEEDSLELEVRKKGPSDCRWEMDWSFEDESSFSNQGRLKFLDLLSLLFINCFWNGIVTVFLLAPFQEDGNFPWWIYLFLLPFVLVGLVLIFTLVTALLEPWRNTTWKFSSFEIIRTYRFFGIPFTKRWNVRGQVRMSLELETDRRNSSWKKIGLRPSDLTPSDGEDYELVFLFDDDSKMRWRHLTRGEAEWITTQLEKHRSEFVVDSLSPDNSAKTGYP